jgi:hypothetical protein
MRNTFKRLLLVLLAGLVGVAAGKTDKWQSVFRDLNLDFEKKSAGKPAGWTGIGGVEYVVDLDEAIVHGGKNSCRIRSVHLVDEEFGGIVQTLRNPDLGGQRVRFSGYLKWDRVTDYATLWVRGDYKGKPVAFDSQQGQKLRGTRDWKEYEVVVNLPRQIDAVFFGVLLGGEGEVWADDFKLEVVTVDSDVQKRAAIEWMMLVDDGKYGESWKAASKKLQSGMARVAWESRMNTSRKPLGKVLSRTWTSLQPGAQSQGSSSVVLEAKTSFEQKPDALESLTLILDAGGVWKVAEYAIR